MRHRGPRSLPALWRRRPAPAPRRVARAFNRPRLRVVGSLAAASVIATGGLVVAGELDTPERLETDPPAPHRGGTAPEASRDGGRSPLQSVPARPTASLQPLDTTDETMTGGHASRDTDSGGRQPRQRTRDPQERRPALTTPTAQLPSRTPTGAVESGVQGLPDAPSTREPSPGPTSAGSSSSPTDDTPPETSLYSGPRTHDDGPFRFGADEPASFTCSLDGGPFRACSSPEHVDVGPGRHTFAVRATDRAGNADDSPATWSWLATGLGDPLDETPRVPTPSGVDNPR